MGEEMNRLAYIRYEEKKYHDFCYNHYKLFEEGSWLFKPVQTVIELLPLFNQKENIQVLDLGCGVGRNSIPIAEAIKDLNGQVFCIDILQSALNKLKEYSKEYRVEEAIQPVRADIGGFSIKPNRYDLIVAVSSLEHVQSESTFEDVVRRMAGGTKTLGVNCLVVNTEVEEILIETKEKLQPLMEVNMKTEKMISKLKNIYEKWEVLKVMVKPLEYTITRNEESVLLKTNAVTLVVRKNI